MLYESYKSLPTYESKSIINTINGYLMKGNKLTHGMEKLIKLVIEQGYSVEKNDEGYFLWSKKKS